MKWYQVTRCSNTVENPLLTGVGDLGGMEEWQLRKGQFLANWPSGAWIGAEEAEDDGDPDDVLQNHLGLPIFSPRLRRELNALGIQGIQYLPIEVRRSDGTPIPGFSIANIIDLRPALDTKRTKYSVFSDDSHPSKRGKISSINLPILKSEFLTTGDIFRLEEYVQPIFVSERIKDSFEAKGFTGFTFRRVRTDQDQV